MMDDTIKDFEAAIAELATIVKKLEDGDLALEASLAEVSRLRDLLSRDNEVLRQEVRTLRPTGALAADSPVMREISRSDFFFRPCKRRILPIMSMVITPHPLLHKNSAE